MTYELPTSGPLPFAKNGDIASRSYTSISSKENQVVSSNMHDGLAGVISRNERLDDLLDGILQLAGICNMDVIKRKILAARLYAVAVSHRDPYRARENKK